MENTKDDTQKEEYLQWHPAFYAAAQIELREEAEYLEFENEHQLSTKPMAIDVLVIKNEQNRKIQKNIGRIFRKYNVIEYKSPTDYISIDTFYKIYGYACFYKADTGGVDAVAIEEMTITLFGREYPRKLIKHLKEVRGYRVEKQEEGIYYVDGDMLPIQILVGKQLSPKENLWLRGLTNELESYEILEKLVRDYQEHSENVWYQSALDIIVRANEKKLKEDNDMVCDTLMEIMADKLEEREKQMMERAEERGLEQGMEQGMERGMKQGLERFGKLTQCLLEDGRIEELKRATEDVTFQKQLMKEYKIL